MDPPKVLLGFPALNASAIPPGADTTMTAHSAAQACFVVVAVFCTVIPAFFLLLRIYTKLTIVGSLEWADYFLFLAFPLLVTEIGIGAHMVRWGAGVHQWQVTLDQIFHQLHWANIGQAIYCPLSYLVKMAILLQYIRIFAPSRSINPIMCHSAWLTMLIVSIMYTGFFFWTLFACTPRRKIWDRLIQDGHCHSVSNIVLSQGAFNMITDMIVLILPTITLWRLRVPLNRKISITVLFGSGMLACIASLMRIIFTLKIDQNLTKADVSRNALFIGLWTQAEVSIGFIVGCSLSLPKLIRNRGRKIKQLSSNSSSPHLSMSSRFNVMHCDEHANSSRLQGENINCQPTKFSEDPEAQRSQLPARLQPVQQVRDAYVLPSPLESSAYSYSLYSQGDTCQCLGEEHGCTDPVCIVRTEILRSISSGSREVPIRFDRLSVPSYPLNLKSLPGVVLEEIPLNDELLDEGLVGTRSSEGRLSARKSISDSLPSCARASYERSPEGGPQYECLLDQGQLPEEQSSGAEFSVETRLIPEFTFGAFNIDFHRDTSADLPL